MPRRHGKLFVVSSPSGGGKTSVIKYLLKQLPDVALSVSVTTRAKRPGERQGVDYRFISRAQFARMRARRQLLEWATVHGSSYGTPKAPVVRATARGRDVMLSIDVQGAKSVRRAFGSRAVLVFLVPPSLAVLKKRLLKRSTETPDAVRKRLRAAQREMACAAWYDYAIPSVKIDESGEFLKTIILAERFRVSRG